MTDRTRGHESGQIRKKKLSNKQKELNKKARKRTRIKKRRGY